MQRLGAIVLVVCLASVGVARADETRDAEARRYYEEGTKFYSLGEFQKAIEQYKKAFEIKPDPVFLYNIAQAYRLDDNLPRALFFYKSFLRNMPTAPNRAEVENRIRELEATIARQKEAAGAPPNDPVEPSTSTTTTTTEPLGEPPLEDPPTGEPAPTKLPGPDEAALAGGTASEPTSAPIDSGPGKKPIYKKWWFWAGVGAVAVGTIAIVAVSSGGGGASAPDSHFGSHDFF